MKAIATLLNAFFPSSQDSRIAG